MAIEHFFGTLKGQFCRLKDCLDVNRVDDVPILVIASCILHNLAILHYEDIMDFIDDEHDDDNDNQLDVFPPNRLAEVKRCEIVHLLRSNRGNRP